MPKAWEWPGSVVSHIVDGDSFDAVVQMDIGFYGKFIRTQRLRIAGIDCDDIHTPLGDAAIARVLELTKDVTVLIVTLKPYKYGDEWMANIILPDGRSVASVLVLEGLAVPWDGKGVRPSRRPKVTIAQVPKELP